MSISLLLKCQRFFSSSMPFLVLELSIILWLHRGGIVGSSSSSSSSFILGCFHHRWPYSSSSIILHPMLPSSVNNQGKGLGGGWSPRWLSASTTKQAQQEDELFESIDPKNTSSSSSSSSPSSLRHKHIPSLHNSTAAAATASSDILLDGRINNTHSLNLKTLDVLSLSSIRSTLIRQEETIIFGLIERAQFRSNVIVYEKNGFGNLGIPDGAVISDDRARSELERLSFLEYMLLSTEILHNKVRRYTSPEEHPFFPAYLPKGPMSNLAPLDYPTDLLSSAGGASELNFNSILIQRYIEEIIPSITIPGDDEQHGSSVVNDVTLLQALSRRIHYGKFVAESKYRDNPEKYQALVDADDDEGVMALLTNIDVEKKLLRRVRLKAANYGREPMDLFVDEEQQNNEAATEDAERRMVAVAAATAVMVALESWDRTRRRTTHNNGDSSKVDPRVIEAIYRDILIPLTKDVEVAYLFRRCGKEPPPKYLGSKAV